MMTAAIAFSSIPTPVNGEPAFAVPTNNMPPIAPDRPLMTYTEMSTLLTGRPVRTAASGLPPTA